MSNTAASMSTQESPGPHAKDKLAPPGKSQPERLGGGCQDKHLEGRSGYNRDANGGALQEDGNANEEGLPLGLLAGNNSWWWKSYC